MKYLALAFTLIFSFSGPVNANSVNGSFICQLVFSDNSGYDVYITTTDSGITKKDIKYGDESKYLEIHRGKTNDFRVFVQIGNWLHEDIIVLTATEDKRVFHYITSMTNHRETVSSKVVRGTCNKV